MEYDYEVNGINWGIIEEHAVLWESNQFLLPGLSCI